MNEKKYKQQLEKKYAPYFDEALDLHSQDSHGFCRIDEEGCPPVTSKISISKRRPTRFDHAVYPGEVRTSVREEIKELLTKPSLLRGTKNIMRFAGTTLVIFLGLMLFVNAGAYMKVGEYVVASIFGQNASHNFDALDQKQTAIEAAAFEKNVRGMYGSIPETSSTNGTVTASLLKYFEVLPSTNRIIIPKIGQNIPIQDVPPTNLLKENWQALEEDIQEKLQYGVVHYPGTASPGEIGNVFITGHSSYYLWEPGKYKDTFALLHNVEIGDTITIFYKQKRYDYVITEKKVVSPKQVDVLAPSTDKRLTLMTCTPIGTALNRLVVIAKQK